MENLDGSHRGSCAVCVHGTDTAISIRGDAPGLPYGLESLGVPRGQAVIMVRDALVGMVARADGAFTMPVAMCSMCAPSGIRPGLIDDGDIPVLTQPGL